MPEPAFFAAFDRVEIAVGETVLRLKPLTVAESVPFLRLLHRINSERSAEHVAELFERFPDAVEQPALGALPPDQFFGAVQDFFSVLNSGTWRSRTAAVDGTAPPPSTM